MTPRTWGKKEYTQPMTFKEKQRRFCPHSNTLIKRIGYGSTNITLISHSVRFILIVDWCNKLWFVIWLSTCQFEQFVEAHVWCMVTQIDMFYLFNLFCSKRFFIACNILIIPLPSEFGGYTSFKKQSKEFGVDNCGDPISARSMNLLQL